MGRIRVFEDANRLDAFDLVCPNCGNIIASPYRGKTNRLSKKCPSCGTRLEEYKAIAISHGDTNEYDIRDMHRTLRDYWERESHGELKQQDFARAADEFGIYDY